MRKITLFFRLAFCLLPVVWLLPLFRLSARSGGSLYPLCLSKIVVQLSAAGLVWIVWVLKGCCSRGALAASTSFVLPFCAASSLAPSSARLGASLEPPLSQCLVSNFECRPFPCKF